MSDKPQKPDIPAHEASTKSVLPQGAQGDTEADSVDVNPAVDKVLEEGVLEGEVAASEALEAPKVAEVAECVLVEDTEASQPEALTPSAEAELEMDKPPEQTAAGIHQKARVHKPSSKAPWVIAVLMFLGWSATAGGGYWVYLQQQASEQSAQDLTAQLSDVKAQVQQTLAQSKSEVTGELTQFKQGVNTELKAIEREATGDLRKLASQIKEHEARLNGQQERLAGLTTTSREDWLLAEAEYLLKLANQRVLLERTPQNVVALLSRADQIIERVSAGLGDRELFAIRKLLAEETTALKMVEPVDTQGIYLKLGALANTVNNLSALPAQQERFSHQAAKQEPEEAPLVQVSSTQTQVSETFIEEFKREMGSFFGFIRNAFSWYSEDELAAPIVSQQRLQLMQLNTRLLIEQAQISLLKEDPVSYQESLKAASTLAAQYYFESPARTALADELNRLAQKNIAPELPDISKSLKLLHLYIADQHRLNTPSAGQLSGKGAQ